LERGETRNNPNIAAEAADGLFVALGWTATADGPSEYRIVLDGRVHPAHRRKGLGAALLRWSEERGRERLHALPGDRRKVLRIDSPGVTPDADVLYQRHGFRLHFAEDMMERRLDVPLPPVPLPPAVELATWDARTLAQFYAAYTGSFRERPGFPGWSQDEWVEWVSADDDFRPDASYVAIFREQPIGFVATGVGSATASDADRSGWITQVGTIPEWRGRGLGAALIVHVMQQFRAESLGKVALFVNTNNPSASVLYRQLGFETVTRRTIYHKQVE
jgi:mycothiol synthase